MASLFVLAAFSFYFCSLVSDCARLRARVRVQNIFKRLFRVYAHIYYCHFERMSALGAEGGPPPPWLNSKY